MKYPERKLTYEQAAQTVKALLMLGEDKVTIIAKENGCYQISTSSSSK